MLDDTHMRLAVRNPCKPGYQMEGTIQSQKDSNFCVFCHPDVTTENVSGKGRSLKATKRIEPGTRLVSEVPATAVAQSDAAALDEAVQLIVSNSDLSARFAGLCTLPVSPGPDNCGGSGSKVSAAECIGAHEKARSQAKANAFGATTPSGDCILSLFSMISLCNHSCSPSCALSRISPGVSALPSTAERTLYTIRAVEPGEEITLCYDSALLWLPEAIRRQKTTTVWCFTCTCERCMAERAAPLMDSFTGIERYFDGEGKLMSGVMMVPVAKNEMQPTVVDMYEEASEFFGPSHWRTHVTREACLHMMLETAPEEFDFDMLLEHLVELTHLAPPSHPHFLTWFTRMQQVVQSNEAEIMDNADGEVDWGLTVRRLRALVAEENPEVLKWNHVPTTLRSL